MADMNFETARRNMVEQQIRPWEVLDGRVLDAMTRLPREEFVPPHHRKLAFTDMELPIGEGQVAMLPKMVGRMLQALDVQQGDRVLEVGTGTGYATALLAGLASAGHVFSVDIFQSFTTAAARRLKAHGLANVTLETGNAVEGWERHAGYDVVAITGSLPALGEGFRHFRNSLKVGGRLFVVVGEAPVMEACLITRTGEGSWRTESLFETVLPPLLHAPRVERFAL